jgi:hypothetical protein
MNENTKRTIRRLIPLVWVVVAIVGFLVNDTVGLILVIAVGIGSVAAYGALGGRGPVGAGGRARSRDRQRDRQRDRVRDL